MRDEGDRAAILARRKRFIAVALAGLGGCAPEPAPQAPSGEAPGPAAPSALPVVVAPPVDSDGDGVLDADDQCPTESAGARSWLEHPGCPAPRACLMIIPYSEIQVLAKIQFDRFSRKVSPRAAPLLDDVAKVLTQNPTLDLDVAGHCEKPEQKAIAKQRAEAVRDALVTRGVEKGRLRVLDAAECEAPVTGDAAASDAARSVGFSNVHEREKKQGGTE